MSLKPTIGWACVGVGGAGIALGAVTGAIILSKKSQLDADGCQDGHCYDDQAAAVDSMNALRPVSTWGLLLGAASAAAGVALLTLTPGEPQPARGVEARLGVGKAEILARF